MRSGERGPLMSITFYFGGQLAVQMKNSTTYFIHTDHLGSTRVVTNLSGGVFDSLDYLPFGEQIAGDTGTTHKFTGKERDAESGLDEFGARYDSSTLGRFMTPDWAAKPTTVPYASFGDPQTLNLYSYVENAPVNRADADGHTGIESAGFVQPRSELSGNLYPSAEEAASLEDASFLVTFKDGTSQLLLAQQVQAALKNQIPSDIRHDMASAIKDSDAPTKDDKKGGFHEESGVAGELSSGDWTISRDKPGPYESPDGTTNPHTTGVPTDQNVANAIVDPEVFFHVHPSGRTLTHFFKQPPSEDSDIPNAVDSKINIVFGAGDKQVYFYNTSGVIGMPISLKDFLR